MSSSNHNIHTITDSSPPVTSAAEKLFAILNRDDRFKLAEDPTVPAGELDNDIHPIFNHAQFLGRTEHLRQALQLASRFLTTPTLLEFYLPLIFGDYVTVDGNFHRVFNRPNESDRFYEIEAVRSCLMCMAHTTKWEWKQFKEEKKWGSTQQYYTDSPGHTDQCPTAEYTKTPSAGERFLNEDRGCLIKLNRGILAYYLDKKTGYVTRSRCEQFRHDFQLAAVLGHEITHAFGAMLHSNLIEPWLSEDHPRNELGFAWENFVFGTLIDPTDRDPRGEYIHLHKTWQSRDVREKYRGTELTAVPVAWTAQWFRKETWEVIKLYGHHAVNLPDPTLKVYLSAWNNYIVFTDNEDAWKDLEEARYSASLSYLFAKGSSDSEAMKDITAAAWMPMIDLAKEPFMATPQRRFDEELVDERLYIQNARDRERATWPTQEIAEKRQKRLARTRMISVAAGLIKSSRHVSKPRPVRIWKRMSVAAGPMSSSSSDSSSPTQVRSRAKRLRDADHHNPFLPSKKA